MSVLISSVKTMGFPKLDVDRQKDKPMKSTKVLTLSSVCKQDYCTLITFAIVNFLLALELLNIVNIY